MEKVREPLMSKIKKIGNNWKKMKKVLIILFIILIISSCDKSETFYISNINIVDVSNGQILENKMIEIEDGVISNIIDNYDISDKDFNSFNGDGMFVTPGLSDMNVFLKDAMKDVDYWGVHPGDRMLASGVTTIRAVRFFKDPGVLIEFEEEFRGNLTAGPDIIKSTVANYSSGKNIENLISEIAYSEADYINVMNIVPSEQMNSILNYANEHEIYTCCTIYSFDDLVEFSSTGFNELLKISNIITLLIDDNYIDTIDWLDGEDIWEKYDMFFSDFYDLSEEDLKKKIEPALKNIINILKRKNIAVTTALSVDEISAIKIVKPDDYLEYTEKYNIPKRADTIYLLNKSVLGDHFRLEAIPEFVKFEFRIEKIILQQLKENGIFVLSGSGFVADAWYGIAPGIALHDELNILMECGYSNLEALQTATLNASIIGEKMNITEKWGRIDPGYRADLLFTKDNPLLNLEVLRIPEYVMKSGHLYSDAELKKLR